VNHLRKEIEAHFSTFTKQLPQNITQVKVMVFLVPMESIEKLINEFNTRCKTLGDLQA
jgi:hypothetical protein